MKKILIVFGAGLLEQFGYTLYLIAVNKYLILVSSILMFFYMAIYLWLMDRIIKNKNSIKFLLIYAFACGIGNSIAMFLHLIK